MGGESRVWSNSHQCQWYSSTCARMEACGCINCACALPNLSRVLSWQWWNPLGNESARQEIDDLPGRSDLGKPGGGRYLRLGGTDDGACVRTSGVWGHAPPEKNFKLGALRSLLRPYLYSNLYLDSMPLENRAQVFLERRSPCSGIADLSLHVFQRRVMVKKVTARTRQTV